MFWTAIEVEILFTARITQMRFLKRLSGKTPREQNSSGEKIGAESAVPMLVYLYIILIVHKYRQPAKRKVFLKRNTVPEVFPLTAGIAGSGKTVPFEKRHAGCEKREKINRRRIYDTLRINFFEATKQTACIFSKGEETGVNYYGARYLDPKYSRWLSGDPALSDYIPKAPIDDEAKKHNENLPGMGGVYNTVNLHLYHYAGNNPVKYTDPDGKISKTAMLDVKWKCLIQNLDNYTTIKHELAAKIIANNHQIDVKKGEIFNIHSEYIKQEVSDFFALYSIFSESVAAVFSNSGSPEMMLSTFIDNINIQSLAEHMADGGASGNHRITKKDLKTFTFNKMIEIRNLKAQNVANKAALKEIKQEIINIKKLIDELRMEE